MADIQDRTQDVSILDNQSGLTAGVVTRKDGVAALAVTDKPLGAILFEQGRLFSVNSNVVTLGTTAESPVFLIRNPNASGMTLHLYRISVDIAADSSSTYIRVYKNATVTANGTAVATNKLNTDGTYTPQTLGSISPTVTYNGTVYKTWVFAKGIGNADNGLVLDGLCTLAPNENLLVTVQGAKDKEFAGCLIIGESARP